MAGMLLHDDREKQSYEPEKTATFLFKTPEGTPGLLFVGVEVHDDTQQPGGIMRSDIESSPIGFFKGRRFGYRLLE